MDIGVLTDMYDSFCTNQGFGEMFYWGGGGATGLCELFAFSFTKMSTNEEDVHGMVTVLMVPPVYQPD